MQVNLANQEQLQHPHYIYPYFSTFSHQLQMLIPSHLNEKKAIKKYNKIIAEKLIFSIEFLKNSNSLKDVADYQNFRLHELKYERKGQFAIDLGKTTGYRLIIEPITVNEKNEVISYESINIIEIMEVSNHYE